MNSNQPKKTFGSGEKTFNHGSNTGKALSSEHRSIDISNGVHGDDRRNLERAVSLKREEKTRELTADEKSFVRQVERTINCEISFDKKNRPKFVATTGAGKSQKYEAYKKDVEKQKEKRFKEDLAYLDYLQRKGAYASFARKNYGGQEWEEKKDDFFITESSVADRVGNLSKAEKEDVVRVVALKREEKKRPLSLEEKATIRTLEKKINAEVLLNKRGGFSFRERTDIENFARRDKELMTDKVIKLRTHLKKSDARKADYKIKKGITDKKTSKKPSEMKATLNYAGRNLDRAAGKVLQGSAEDDMGSQTVAMTYATARTTLAVNARLTAFNKNLPNLLKKGYRAGKKTITIGKKTFKIGTDFYKAFKYGMLSGTLNMYKDLIFKRVGTAIKYSSTVYKARNIYDAGKTIILGAGNLKTFGKGAVKLVRGVKQGSIIITKKNVKNIGKALLRPVKGLGRAGKGVVSSKTFKGGTAVAKGGFNLTGSFLKNISGGDDYGSTALSGAVTTLETAARGYKFAGKASAKTVKTFGKVGVKTGKAVYRGGKGIYRFSNSVSRFGFKATSKLWVGAAKRASKKVVIKGFSSLVNLSVKALTAVATSILSNPILLMGLIVMLCATVSVSTATVGVAALTGGLVEAVEELVDGLVEVAETVGNAIADFFSSCIGWIANLFGGGDDDEGFVDVDIGDSLSICEYLVGAVQLLKAEVTVKTTARIERLMEEQGYHGAVFYNMFGDSVQINDFRDPDKGLMSDKDYVMAIMPVWKSIILGTIGTDYTGRQANDIAKECFNVLTDLQERPYVDIDGDGLADYVYCDGSLSLTEGENFVVTHVGGAIQSGIGSYCYNNSSVLYHASKAENTHSIHCDTEWWTCGGHYRYTCMGHSTPTFCADLENCANLVDGACGGHVTTEYCFEGISVDDSHGCTNCFAELYFDYYGYSTTSTSCTNEEYHFKCWGYQLCKGHKLLKYTVGNKDFNALIDEKFLDRIHELEAKISPTPEERAELRDLKSYYNFAVSCEEFEDPIAEEFFETYSP